MVAGPELYARILRRYWTQGEMSGRTRTGVRNQNGKTSHQLPYRIYDDTKSLVMEGAPRAWDDLVVRADYMQLKPIQVPPRNTRPFLRAEGDLDGKESRRRAKTDRIPELNCRSSAAAVRSALDRVACAMGKSERDAGTRPSDETPRSRRCRISGKITAKEGA